MTKTVTGDFADEAAMKNAMDDLISNGIPREEVFMDTSSLNQIEVFMDTEHMQLKVMVPDAMKGGVGEILERHHAKNLH